MAGGTATRKTTAAGVMAHPVRVQILVVANQRPISASRFVEEVLGIPAAERPDDYKQKLSHVAYHFTALREAGCIEVVDLIQRRGAYEHVYVGTLRARFDHEDWSEVDDEKKCRITTVTWQGLVARTEAARIAGTIYSRDDRTVAWTAAEMDEQGVAEMLEFIVERYPEMERIREESEARVQESGEPPIPITFAMLGYESPAAK